MLEKKFHIKVPTRRNPTQERPVEREESSDWEVGKKVPNTSGVVRIHQMTHDEQKKGEEMVQINKNRGRHKKKYREKFLKRGEGKCISKCKKRCSDQYTLKST